MHEQPKSMQNDDFVGEPDENSEIELQEPLTEEDEEEILG